MAEQVTQCRDLTAAAVAPHTVHPRSSADQAERMKLYGEVQEIVGNDYIHVLVAQPASVVTLSDKVVGYKYNVAHHQTFNIMDIGLK